MSKQFLITLILVLIGYIFFQNRLVTGYDRITTKLVKTVDGLMRVCQ